MDTSKLVERSARLAQSTKDQLAATVQDIVADAGDVAQRVVRGRHNLTDSDIVVAASLAEISEYIAQAFVDLPEGKRHSISDAADGGNMRPLDTFVDTALRDATPAQMDDIWKGADMTDLKIAERPAPDATGSVETQALAKTASRGFRFGSALVNGISLLRFVGTLADPRRSLLSKGLRVGTVVAQMGWSRSLPGGESESLPADVLMFADAMLGPLAVKHSPNEKLRRYWRQNTMAALHDHLERTPLRAFLIDVAEKTRLDVSEAHLINAPVMDYHLRSGSQLNEAHAARILPALFREMSFSDAVVTGSGTIAVARVVKIGLQKKVLEASDTGDTLWVRGAGLARPIAVPDGQVLVGVKTYSPLRSMLAAAAASEAYQNGQLVQVAIVLSTVCVSALPDADTC